MKKFRWEHVFILVCLGIFGYSVYRITVKKNNSNLIPSPESPAADQQEYDEKIAQIKTRAVEISETGINPASLSIEVLDQVAFFNKSTSTIWVKGENWGNIPLDTEKNMTQPFKSAGKFGYEVEGLETRLRGEIIVK